MTTIFDAPPKAVQTDLDALNAALNGTIPKKKKGNVLIATWNIRKFGGLTRKWVAATEDSPKRDLQALRTISDIISRFDVIAVQEVTGDLRALRDMISYLGSNWAFLMTDVTLGSAGNKERLAFLFDNKRVRPSGLAGEVVIPPEWLDKKGNPSEVMTRQFARTPYAVSFLAGEQTFILLTAHIDYGNSSDDRIQELKTVARWMSDWGNQTERFHHNMMVLGDFNIDRQKDKLWEAFTSSGLETPKDLDAVKRTVFVKDGADPRRDKYYDQIAWFGAKSGKKKALQMRCVRGGGFDFLPYSYTALGLSVKDISYRISDHYPLWVEFER